MSVRLFNVLRSSQQIAGSSFRGASIPQRTFSSSIVRQKPGVVPIFAKTSSPELDEIIARFREQHIVLGYLSPAQKELITKKKHEKTLESEPLVANIGGEEFSLKHVDAWTDLRNQRDEFWSILKLMKGKDWDNLPGLLEGLNARRGKERSVLTKEYRNKRRVMVRAAAAGRQDIILECIRQADATGMTIPDPQEAFQALRTMYTVALDSDFDAASTKKALAWTEQVLEQMEEPRNQSFRKANTRPTTLGQPLDLAARLALLNQDAGTIARVEAFAKIILANWAYLRTPDRVLTVDRPIEGEEPKKNMAFKDQYLVKNSPLLHGLRVAQEVLSANTELVAELKQKADELEGMVKSVYKEVTNDPWGQETKREGCALYEKLF